MFRFFVGGGLILVNVIAYLVMLQTNMLVGDVSGYPVQNYKSLNISILIVSIVYFLYLFPIFEFLRKIKVPKLKYGTSLNIARNIGLIIFCLQMLFVCFNLINGVNTAGSGNEKTTSVFSIFWVFMPIDLLFFIYYAYYRDSSLFKANAAVALVSLLLRGQAGVLLVFVFFELARGLRRKSLSKKKLVLVVSSILVLYPFLNILKFAFRLYFGGSSDLALDGYIIELFNTSQAEGYIYSLISGIEHIIYRLQVVSIVNEINELSGVLMVIYESEGFFPFWSEGIHGLTYDRLFDKPRNVPLGTVFTSVGNFSWSFEYGSWNVNPGLAGWYILNPLWGAGLFLYTTAICFISIVLSKLIGDSELRDDMVWYSWAFYLMPGWLGVLVLFIYALLLFVILKYILSWFPNIILNKQSNLSK